jgi:hypothetical protein
LLVPNSWPISVHDSSAARASGDETLDQCVAGVAEFATELDRDAQPRGRELLARTRPHELRKLVNRRQPSALMRQLRLTIAVNRAGPD